MKKVVLFGNQQIAIDCLKKLIKFKDVNLHTVIVSETSEDKKQGYASLREYCKHHKIKYLDPNKLDDKFENMYKNWNIDIAFSIYYRKIISKKIIECTKEGIVNIHPSLLPGYRGPVPGMWALLNNERKLGVTMHYINEGIDTGDIIDQTAFTAPDKITGFELNNLLMKKGAKLFNKKISLLLAGNVKAKQQDHAKATYYGKFNDSIRNINWYESCANIERKVRVFTKPYGGARSYVKKNKIIFWNSEIVGRSKKELNGPGKVVDIEKDYFIVSCVDGYLKVSDFRNCNNINLNPGVRFDLE